MNRAPSAAFADRLGRPLTHGSLGHPTCWFSGGRVACSVADHGGIETISYWGRQPFGRNAFFNTNFRSAYPRVFRAQVLVGTRAYTIGVGNGRLHAAGWVGTMDIPEEGLELDIALVCANRSIVQTVRHRNGGRARLGLRLMIRDYVRVEATGRTWGAWEEVAHGFAIPVTDLPPAGPHEEGSLTQAYLRYDDEHEARTTWIGVTGTGPCTMRTWRSQMRAFTTAPRAGASALALLFHDDREALLDHQQHLKDEAGLAAWATIAAWERADHRAPTLAGLDPVVASFAQQAPALLRAAMPDDCSGAMRASYNAYWIWGWDTLVHARAYLLAGHAPFLAAAIDLLARTAHPQFGIGHMFDSDLRLRLTQALPAQGLLAIAVWQSHALTGDLDLVRRHWTLLVTLLERTLAAPARDGLVAGAALFPDYPECAGHTGRDVSVFNNGIHYQACRCLEALAGELKDERVARLAATAAEACRLGFRRRFWDPRRGFWCDSIDADDGQRRPSYPSHAILWVCPFARELVEGVATPAAVFTDGNHRIAGGLRMYPAWDPAFNADGNQLGQHFSPGQDPLYVRLMAMSGNQAGLRRWLGWVRGNWQGLSVPEGCTLDGDNDGPQRPDNPGGRQMFTVKSWYDTLIGAIIGLDVDGGGLTVSPGLDAPLAARGLPLAGGSWTIAVSGTGPWIRRIVVAGRSWAGTAKVPLPAGSSARTITITRSKRPPRVAQLCSADGAAVLSSVVAKGVLTLRLSAPGRVLLRLGAKRKPHLLLDGHVQHPDWDPTTGIASLWIQTCSAEVTVSARLPASRKHK